MAGSRPRYEKLPAAEASQQPQELVIAHKTDYATWFNSCILLATIGVVIYGTNKPMALVMLAVTVLLTAKFLALYVYETYGKPTNKTLHTWTHATITSSASELLALFSALLILYAIISPVCCG